MSRELAAGQPPGRVMQGHGVWENRKARVGRALRRVPAARWEHALRACAQADRLAKGQAQGDAWHALRVLATRLAGGPAL
jgi:DNA polymerase-3 subunit delta